MERVEESRSRGVDADSTTVAVTHSSPDTPDTLIPDPETLVAPAIAMRGVSKRFGPVIANDGSISLPAGARSMPSSARTGPANRP